MEGQTKSEKRKHVRNLVKKLKSLSYRSETQYNKFKTSHEKIISGIMKQVHQLVLRKLKNNQNVMDGMEIFLSALMKTCQQNRLAYSNLKESGYEERYWATKIAFVKLVEVYETFKMKQCSHQKFSVIERNQKK